MSYHTMALVLFWEFQAGGILSILIAIVAGS